MDQNTLVVIENTGIYHRLIWSFCNQKGLPLHIGNAVHIKWSFGIARGKNDKIDSIRLCRYACKEVDTLKAAPALNPVLMQLKDFMTSTTRLLSQINSNKQYIKELKNINDPMVQKAVEKAHRTAIEGIAGSIKEIEALIDKIIAENPELKNNYDLLITVPGIGHLTAVYLICCTTNFSAKISVASSSPVMLVLYLLNIVVGSALKGVTVCITWPIKNSKNYSMSVHYLSYNSIQSSKRIITAKRKRESTL